MYGLCKQNYAFVMEEVQRSIDCEKGRNDEKSLSYSRRLLGYEEPDAGKA